MLFNRFVKNKPNYIKTSTGTGPSFILAKIVFEFDLRNFGI